MPASVGSSQPWRKSAKDRYKHSKGDLAKRVQQKLAEQPQKINSWTARVHHITRRTRENVWQSWLHFCDTSTPKLDPKQVWVELCNDKDCAKQICADFLRFFIRMSEVEKPTVLDPEGWIAERKIKQVSTLRKRFNDLLFMVDELVLRDLRRQFPDQANKWYLRQPTHEHRVRHNPAFDVAKQLVSIGVDEGLCRVPQRKKVEVTRDDLFILLASIWKAEHLGSTPSDRVAFHCAVLLSALTGARPISFLQITYRQVEFSLCEDKNKKRWLCCKVNMEHGKILENTVDEDGKESYEFSLTTLPIPSLCLATMLFARARADNAFPDGTKTLPELLESSGPQKKINLPWKDSVRDEEIIPINDTKYRRMWKRAWQIAGVRQIPRPYAMRVAAGRRLNDATSDAMRNRIMGHTTDVFNRSYISRDVGINLARILFEEIVPDDANAALEATYGLAYDRDPSAPLYLSQADLDLINNRDDILDLETLKREETDPKRRKEYDGRINTYKKSFRHELLQQRYQEYFAAVDLQAAMGDSSLNLRKLQIRTNLLSGRYGKIIDPNAGATYSILAHGNTQEAITCLMLYLAQEKVTAAGGTVPCNMSSGGKPQCFLCMRQLYDKRNLANHVKYRHSRDLSPARGLSCMACSGDPFTSMDAWVKHTKAAHGVLHTPDKVPEASTKLYGPKCFFCLKGFCDRRSLTSHIKSQHLHTFGLGLPCKECEAEPLNSLDEYARHVDLAHGTQHCPKLPRPRGQTINRCNIVEKKRPSNECAEGTKKKMARTRINGDVACTGLSSLNDVTTSRSRMAVGSIPLLEVEEVQ